MEAIAEAHRLTGISGKSSMLVTAQSNLKRLMVYEAHIKELKFAELASSEQIPKAQTL